MARSTEERAAYRCAVAPEHSSAKLLIGRKTFQVTVLETSRNGFGVRVDNALAKKLREGKSYELSFSKEKWKVTKESHYSDGDWTVVGFHREKELTKVKVPTGGWFPFLRSNQTQTDPSFLMYLMLAFLFVCIAMPGMGDSLGTAPRIQAGFKMFLQTINDILW